MDNIRPIFLLILGLLFISFLTALLSQSFNPIANPNQFSGIIYQQPVIDGRYKSISLANKKIYLSRYDKIEQGDYVNLDFSSCRYNEKFKSYDKCKIQIDPAKENKFLKNILNLRNEIISRAKMRMPSPHDYLVLAMTIGYEDNLPESLTEKLREIGAIHMLVVSGYNVSLVLNSSGVLLMRFPRSIYIALSLFLLLIFILLTGFDPPILRSVIMGAFVVFSKALVRPTAALYLLILSAIMMLSWDLNYLANISFQLSFAATFGVIISGYISRSKVGILSDLGASVGASLFVLPIISFYFGTLSILGIVSALLLGWLIPLITYLGFFLYLFDFLPVKMLFVITVGLFLEITDFISYFSFLNIDYKLGIQGLTLYYIFICMLIWFVYKVKELFDLGHE